MPNLIQTYARSTGLKIDKPWLKEDFYPLPFTKYITLATGSGQGAKNYSYYQKVVELLQPFLNQQNIHIVLLGSKEDPVINGVYDLRGKTSVSQSYYLIKNAQLHLGNDSWTAHAAGWSRVPLVALYGSTDKYIHGPHWCGAKMMLLESHRNGCKPSFSSHENLKTIDLIDPFDVIRAVLYLLEIPSGNFSYKSHHIGKAFPQPVLDFVPNQVLSPTFNPDVPTAVRMDVEHNEHVLMQVLQTGRKVNIVTKRPINIQILEAFKNNINSYNHEVDFDCPTEYLKLVNKIISNKTFFTRITDLEIVAKLRLNFFDVINIQHVIDSTRSDYENSVRIFTNNPNFSLDQDGKLDKLSFTTNKFVLSRGKIYLSFAHEKTDISINNVLISKVIDSPEFWKDINHFMTFI